MGCPVSGLSGPKLLVAQGSCITGKFIIIHSAAVEGLSKSRVDRLYTGSLNTDWLADTTLYLAVLVNAA